MSIYESVADRRAILHGLGGVPVRGPLGDCTGILTLDYVAIGDPAPVDSLLPSLTADTDDLARCGVVSGVGIRVGADTYVVRSVQPDGTGMTVLILEAP